MNEVFGKGLMLVGAVLLGVGTLVWLLAKYNLMPGRLPGNFKFEGNGFTVYFPILTCLIISLALSLITWLLRK